MVGPVHETENGDVQSGEHNPKHCSQLELCRTDTLRIQRGSISTVVSIKRDYCMLVGNDMSHCVDKRSERQFAMEQLSHSVSNRVPGASLPVRGAFDRYWLAAVCWRTHGIREGAGQNRSLVLHGAKSTPRIAPGSLPSEAPLCVIRTALTSPATLQLR